MSKEIKIRDLVIIKNEGGSYENYNELAKKLNILDEYDNWNYPENGKTYRVVNKGNHLEDDEPIVAVEDLETHKVYLINEDCVEKKITTFEDNVWYGYKGYDDYACIIQNGVRWGFSTINKFFRISEKHATNPDKTGYYILSDEEVKKVGKRLVDLALEKGYTKGVRLNPIEIITDNFNRNCGSIIYLTKENNTLETVGFGKYVIMKEGVWADIIENATHEENIHVGFELCKLLKDNPNDAKDILKPILKVKTGNVGKVVRIEKYEVKYDIVKIEYKVVMDEFKRK